MISVSDIHRYLDELRRPEYTGPNRCIPCTLINVAIAVGLGLGVGQFSAALGMAAIVVSLGMIYLRGYLVPYTPQLTSRYVPDRVLRSFDHSINPGNTAQEFDVEATLKEANAIEDCEDEENVCLSNSFANAWRDWIDVLNTNDTSRDELARLLNASVTELEFTEYGEAFVAFQHGTRIGQWESRPAFIADIAAAKELEHRSPNWNRLDVPQQGSMLSGLRIFLKTCPSCNGSVSVDREKVKSCCRTIDVIAATCEDCGVRLFESDQVTA